MPNAVAASVCRRPALSAPARVSAGSASAKTRVNVLSDSIGGVPALLQKARSAYAGSQIIQPPSFRGPPLFYEVH